MLFVFYSKSLFNVCRWSEQTILASPKTFAPTLTYTEVDYKLYK